MDGVILQSDLSRNVCSCGKAQGKGDQIGRILVHCVILHFGKFFENYRSSTNFRGTFSECIIYALILTKDGLGFFHKLIWSHCSKGKGNRDS
jgi:hypothetical protein